MGEEGSEQRTAWLWHQEERLALEGDRASSASLGCLGEARREGGRCDRGGRTGLKEGRGSKM